ncbi:hypothetical protein PFISCL1PPCAC_8873, partial [Pristionchus fissidentatus]
SIMVSRLLLIVPMIFLVPAPTCAVPSKGMCDVLYRFIGQYHADRATAAAWLQGNCYRIRQRPADMSCADMITFARDCQNAGTEAIRTETYNRVLGSVAPNTLQNYIHNNRQTVYDYGHFGNAYYPNYTPWHHINGGLVGTPRAQAAQLENEWAWTRGGNYPYMRADNVVNQALQQTMLPTCLHDVIYCAKLSIAQQQAARAAAEAAADPSNLQ